MHNRLIRPLLFSCLVLAGLGEVVSAQTDAPPRVEAGAYFSSVTITEPGGAESPFNNSCQGSRTEAGVGGRVTYNFSRWLAAEASLTLFPRDSGESSEYTGGRVTEALFGVKAGRRFKKFGLFGLAQPGLVRFSRALGGSRSVPDPGSPGHSILAADFRGRTNFAFEAGGAVEFYPTRHVAPRFDIGDTIVRFKEFTFPIGPGIPVNPALPPVTSFTLPGHTQHSLQISAGVSVRF